MERKIQLLVTNPNNRLKEQLFNKDNIKLLDSFAEIVWNPYQREFTAEELKRYIQGKDALITSWGKRERCASESSGGILFLNRTVGLVEFYFNS